MTVRITPRRFPVIVKIPASKSHTIRQLLIASLAEGKSKIIQPLDSLDTSSCIEVCRTFGAEITAYCNGNDIAHWDVRGINGFKDTVYHESSDDTPGSLRKIDSLLKDALINVGNSGTTLYLALAVAGLQEEPVVFTGDEQIQKRSAAPLLDALAGLGVHVQSNNGCAPITVQGPWKGGKVTLPCPTSQYLSALLIAAPLAPAGTVTEIDVPLLNEKPYVEMTLSYLKAHNIPFEAAPDYSRFVVPGGSSWKAFSGAVPADFSSAAFPAAAAAITGGPVTLLGLDPQDTQGDKFFLEMLELMGCTVLWDRCGKGDCHLFREVPLRGGTFDLNKTPDLLPAAAVVAAFAEGDTALVNVAHARIKETDRIAVMAGELAKLGVNCTERSDGLIVHGKGVFAPPTPPVINGHGDHRIVMAFAVAALGCPVPVEITTAECAAVTYPGFLDMLT
jgi:3-phosphoshikimate 1-carboxyvinyltransferase